MFARARLPSARAIATRPKLRSRASSFSTFFTLSSARRRFAAKASALGRGNSEMERWLVGWPVLNEAFDEGFGNAVMREYTKSHFYQGCNYQHSSAPTSATTCDRLPFHPASATLTPSPPSVPPPFSRFSLFQHRFPHRFATPRPLPIRFLFSLDQSHPTPSRLIPSHPISDHPTPPDPLTSPPLTSHPPRPIPSPHLPSHPTPPHPAPPPPLPA